MKTLKYIVAYHWLELSASIFALLSLLYLAVITGVVHLPNIDTNEFSQGFGAIIGVLALVVILIPIIIAILYVCFLPSAIAQKRKHKNLLAIFVLNILAFPSFGLCWIIALVWACTKQ